jgi:glucosamine 6-phosphate synthetase-like amidotransferase/phosphosugar isomerase protein
MCGIAGYSLAADSTLSRTLAAQALLAAIAERGADAVGYAHRAGGDLVVHKQPSGASALLDRIEIPAAATEALVHVRDYTKGHPTIAANNHPVRHGAVVGIHNGIIFDDDELMARHGFERDDPAMTVDSEAIFALAEATLSSAAALEELRGSMAAAWLDERRPGLLYVARGVGRPLWIGSARGELFFASTRKALDIVERYTGRRLQKRELAEGTLLVAAHGRDISQERFEPNRAFEEEPLPSVRAPHEGAFCLSRLAVLAAAAL